MAWRLNFYFARVYCQYFLIVLAIIALGSFLLTLGELFDKTFIQVIPSNTELLMLALYKTPDHIQKIMPMIVLISAITYFVVLGRSRQILMAQQAGMPLLKLSILPLTAVAIIGLFSVSALNPLAATLLERHQSFIEQSADRSKSLLSVANTGIWFRQVVDDKTLIIRAQSFDQSQKRFTEISVFVYQGVFQQRIEAKTAQIEGTELLLQNVIIYPDSGITYEQDTFRLNTNINQEEIENSFKEVRTISVYKLRTFISAIENAGFSAREHQTHFNRLLASPIILLAMFLLAGGMCARVHHRRLPHWQIFCALAVGLVYFVFMTTFQSIGLLQEWPLIFTVWLPHLLFFILLFTYIQQSETLHH